jgi:glutaredoxin-like protein
MFQTYGLDLRNVESKFKALGNDVKLMFFTQETDCAHCNLAKRVFERIASITPKVAFDVYDVNKNQEKLHEFGIFALPALAIVGEKDYGVRYYGYPRGIEIDGFLDDVVYISRGESDLPGGVVERLRRVGSTTNLKVFFSPEYHYSLTVARLGMRLAVANENISSDIIDAIAYLEVAERYGVRGIPTTVVNEGESFQGALDEADYVEEIVTRLPAIPSN